MVWVRGTYRTNHPKDRAMRRYVSLRSYIKDYQINKNQMHNPTEANIKECTVEMKMTTRASKELKKIGRMLGEPTNCETFRRPVTR